MREIPKFIFKNVSLAEHSTLKIGGITRFFAEPESENEIIELLHFALNNNINYTVIGNGSNILFPDGFFNGLVIKIANKFSKISVTGNTIVAQSGAWMPCVAKKSLQYGLTGLEHTIGIPGNIGGIVTMNGGSNQNTIAQNIVNIKYLNELGEIKYIDVKACHFSYRTSVFQEKKWIILTITLSCQSANKNIIRQKMLQILKTRRKKFPRKLPNCGSVFKSNPAYYEQFGPPGQIIDELNLKGYAINDIEVSLQHANFIINKNNAKSNDVIKLVKEIKQKVYASKGIELNAELLYLIDNGTFIPVDKIEGTQ